MCRTAGLFPLVVGLPPAHACIMTTKLPPAPSWVAFARQVIEHAARRDDPGRAVPPSEARSHSGVFVTLHEHGRLRGCMGTLDPGPPLADAVREAALCAAFSDPRFPRVVAAELSELQVEVSIMSPPVRMGRLDDLQLGRHGIIVQRGPRRGLFLPQVATEHHMDKETFLSLCCSEKAGLPPDAWRDPQTEVLLFTSEVETES